MTEYLCIGGPADGHKVLWEGKPKHKQIIEFHKPEPPLPVSWKPEELDRVVATRMTYWFCQWQESEEPARFYLVPIGTEGFKMLDHLIVLAYGD